MKQQIRRITILRLVAVLIAGILLYSLFQLQVIAGAHWADVAQNNHFRHLVQPAPRGKIISADEVELATNVPKYQLALAPNIGSQLREQAIAELSQLLDMDVDDIQQAIIKNSSRLHPAVITNIDYQTVLLLEENRYRIPGLVIQIAPQRIYPENHILAHSLGRTVDGIGREGLERQWDDFLQGEDGYSVVQVNALNRPVSEPVTSQVAIPGSNLHLTIDTGLQDVVQQALHRRLEELREDYDMEDAWTGAALVMDPNTGQILAMVSEPSFDNNNKYAYTWPEELPESDNVRTYRDRVTNWRKPVGSTFKMLTGLAALETGHVTASERIHDGGVTRVAGRDIPNYGNVAYGNIAMRRALQVSSNIYFAKLGDRMGRELIYEYIDRFSMSGVGLGKGVDSSHIIKNAGYTDTPQGEQIYSLDYYKSVDSFMGGDTVQMSYGQLNEFTVMQMGNYVSMLANGGIHYKPYMVEKVTDAHGEVVEHYQPQVLADQDFDDDHLKVIQQGMRDAAASNFRHLPIEVAGKTGTAEEGRRSHSWWVGYAPYDEPEIAIVVFMEYGGLGLRGVDVASDIVEYYFDIDDEDEEVE